MERDIPDVEALTAQADRMVPVFDEARSLFSQGSAARALPAERIETLEKEVSAAAWREGLTVTRGGREVLYPMLGRIRTLTAEFERHLARHLPHVISAWNKVITGYQADAELREFLAVPEPLRAWVDAAPREDHRVDFCRFDLVGGNAGTARIVEFNANCPGGVLFTSAFRRLWTEHREVQELFGQWGVSADLLSERGWFTQLLFASTGATAGDPVALFHQPQGNTLEIQKMRALLTAEHCHVIITHPADDWVRTDIQSGYLKYGVQASLADISEWDVFLRRATSGDLALVNPLPGRWIGDNKLCLAALSDPRFHSLFSETELEAIGRLIPFSRKAGDGVDGRALLEDRRGWVLKGPYDTQGRSVYIGSETDEDPWSKVVTTALRDGWLVQAIVEPGHVLWNGEPAYEDLSVVLLGGRLGGYTSRLSKHLKVNVMQGGERQMVFGNRGIPWPSVTPNTSQAPRRQRGAD
jgi:hypothetical protein